MKIIQTILILSLCSCDQNLKEDQEAGESRFHLQDISSFREEAGDWKITFTSRGGDLAGMDSDSKIAFLSDGSVLLTEYGYAPQYYEGIYTEDTDGVISVSLEEYSGEWPSMVLKKKDGRFLLFRSDGKAHLEFGGRAAAYEEPEMEPFWPFWVSEFSWKVARESDSSGVGVLLPQPGGILPSQEPADGSEQDIVPNP